MTFKKFNDINKYINMCKLLVDFVRSTMLHLHKQVIFCNSSYVKLNTAVSGNTKVVVWTDIRFANSGLATQYSPTIDISTRDGVNNWLGSYSEFTGKRGDSVRLRMHSYTWNGDDVAGTWDYK